LGASMRRLNLRGKTHLSSYIRHALRSARRDRRARRAGSSNRIAAGDRLRAASHGMGFLALDGPRAARTTAQLAERAAGTAGRLQAPPLAKPAGVDGCGVDGFQRRWRGGLGASPTAPATPAALVACERPKAERLSHEETSSRSILAWLISLSIGFAESRDYTDLIHRHVSAAPRQCQQKARGDVSCIVPQQERACRRVGAGVVGCGSERSLAYIFSLIGFEPCSSRRGVKTTPGLSRIRNAPIIIKYRQREADQTVKHADLSAHRSTRLLTISLRCSSSKAKPTK
jgi:hypothetical protein